MDFQLSPRSQDPWQHPACTVLSCGPRGSSWVGGCALLSQSPPSHGLLSLEPGAWDPSSLCPAVFLLAKIYFSAFLALWRVGLGQPGREGLWQGEFVWPGGLGILHLHPQAGFIHFHLLWVPISMWGAAPGLLLVFWHIIHITCDSIIKVRKIELYRDRVFAYY